MQPLGKSATDAAMDPRQRIMLVGSTGSGKTAQIWTLPGKKFVFAFDPNTLPTLKGCPDCTYEEFFPEYMEVDTALKGFNKGSRSDTMKKKREPRLYERWRDYFNDFVDQEYHKQFDWLVFDSMTFVAKAMMDRQLYINNRYGDIEELGDFRVVGSKLTDVFSSISGLPVNIFATGHTRVFEDDKTKRIVTQIFLPGKARDILPLTSTNVWEAYSEEGKNGQEYKVRTVPDRRGLQDIRSSIQGLAPIEDVTIKDFAHATKYGIGALLKRSEVNAIHKRTA